MNLAFGVVPTDLVVEAPDGVALAVRDHGGSGRAVILLHGLGDHLLSVERLASTLLPVFRVVSMDLRWSGRSGSSPVFSWDLLARDVDTVRTTLELGAAFVVGHSLGGIVATHFGVTYPDSPGVANLDGWGFGDPDLYKGMSRAAAEETVDRLRQNADPLAAFPRSGDATWAAGAKAVVRRALATRCIDDAAVDRWVDRTVVEAGESRFCIRPDPTLYESMRSDADVFELLATTPTPTLVVTSDIALAPDDVVAARRRGVATRLSVLRERNPRLSVTSVPGANHDTLLTTHVHRVASAIREFTRTR